MGRCRFRIKTCDNPALIRGLIAPWNGLKPLDLVAGQTKEETLKLVGTVGEGGRWWGRVWVGRLVTMGRSVRAAPEGNGALRWSPSVHIRRCVPRGRRQWRKYNVWWAKPYSYLFHSICPSLRYGAGSPPWLFLLDGEVCLYWSI